eukprot:IDg23476t1
MGVCSKGESVIRTGHFQNNQGDKSSLGGSCLTITAARVRGDKADKCYIPESKTGSAVARLSMMGRLSAIAVLAVASLLIASALAAPIKPALSGATKPFTGSGVEVAPSAHFLKKFRRKLKRGLKKVRRKVKGKVRRGLKKYRRKIRDKVRRGIKRYGRKIGSRLRRAIKKYGRRIISRCIAKGGRSAYYCRLI